MRRLVVVCLLLLFSAASLSPPLVRAEVAEWEVIVPGIEYREFHLPDPNKVFVARLERGNPDLTIESGIAQGRLSGGTETVANMAARYDQAINDWGGEWGARNQVVVAVNGYYFDPYTGIPYQGQVHSGWYAKRFDECETGSGGSGFAWKFDRSAFIGASISHPEAKQFIAYANGATQTFDGVNVTRWSNALILYTPQYDSTTRTDASGAEVLVEMSQPTLISSGVVTGTVRDLRDGGGSTSVPFDHIVLSAHGAAKTTLLANVQIGDVITVSQKVKSYETDCASPSSGPDWTNAYASIGGAFYFLRNGLTQTFADDLGAITRHPRTAIAFNETHVFFVVVDGRDPSFSVGMTIAELADFTRNTLGATYGIAEDGGGSSTMVINGEVKNNTFCNNVYCEGKVFFPLILRPTAGGKIQGESLPKAHLDQRRSPSSRWAIAVKGPKSVSSGKVAVMEGTERMVANGMMMVVVQPSSQSSAFSAGSSLTTLDLSDVRLGPGTNYAVLASLPADTAGTVLAHPLNGVLAKGSYWWRVDFGSVVGWVMEESLAATP